MFEPNVLLVVGGMVAGMIVLKLIEAIISKFVNTDYVERPEFEAFKVARESLLRKEEFLAFKAEFAAHKVSCATCLHEIKEKQGTLRERLPRDYVSKEDFRLSVSEIKDWLKSIDGKVDALLITKEDLLSKGG